MCCLTKINHACQGWNINLKFPSFGNYLGGGMGQRENRRGDKRE
jgi:hypothetical protein